jgi:SSS family solute:Na+ symporter
MQFMILLLGVMVFAFYQFHKEPVFFNQTQIKLLEHSKYKDSLATLSGRYDNLEEQRIVTLRTADSAGWPYAIVDPALVDAHLVAMEREKAGYKATVRRWLDDKTVGGDSNDTNYIFLRFVTDYLPAGLIGLLIAVIFLAAWGSIAATLNSLASCTIVDFHKRFSRGNLSDKQEYRLGQLYTLIWGVFCVAVAQLAYGLGNSLIEAVNVLGSLFYGVILGIFLVAFYRKKTGGQAVFISAVIMETGVIVLTVLSRKGIVPLGFLWFNVIGAVGVVLLSELLQPLMRRPQQQ